MGFLELGMKVGVVSAGGFEARIRELVEGFHSLAAITEPMLAVRKVLREQFAVLHRMLLHLVRQDPVCRRLMTAPGVGAVVALTYRAAVDQPQRFLQLEGGRGARGSDAQAGPVR